MVGTEKRLRQLPDDAGAAEAREGIVALQRRDDWTGGERLGRAVVIGDDHLEPERARVLDLGDGRDAAVDRQDEVEALLGEPRQRLRRSGRTPPRTAREDARRRRPPTRAAAARRAQSRRCRRRRSRRARRCAHLPRPRRRSSRPPHACHRGQRDRGPAAPPRGTGAPRPRRRARGGRAPTRSRRRPRVRSQALAHRRASKTSSSQVPVAIGLSRVRRPSDGFLEKSWKNCSNSLPVLRIFAAGVIAAGLAATSTPASTPTRTVPQGVSIAGVRVGGLSAEPARARIETAFARSIRVTYQGKNIWISPESLGAGLSVERGRQLGPRGDPAEPHRACPSATRAPGSTARSPRSPSASTGRPSTRRSSARPPPDRSSRRRRPGSQSTSGRCAPRSRELLRDGTREPLTLLTHPVAPTRTEASFGPVIVVTRGVNTLRLYDGPNLVRTFQRRDRPGDLPDPRRALADHGQAAEPMVVPADDERLGEGAEAGAARAVATRSARAGWGSTPRASASTARPRRRRSATACRTAASACRCPRRSGSSSTSTSARPSSFSRQLDAEVGQEHDRAGERDAVRRGSSVDGPIRGSSPRAPARAG